MAGGSNVRRGERILRSRFVNPCGEVLVDKLSTVIFIVLIAACGGGATAGVDPSGPAGDAGSPKVDGSVVSLDDGGNSSSPCDPLASADGLVIHVDPVSGDDSLASGSGRASGVDNPLCAFRTLTRAASAAAAAGRQGMTIRVDATATIAAATGEQFPVAVPANTTIAPASGAVVTVQVASGPAFTMPNSGSALAGLVIDGLGSAATGVLVTSGSFSNPNTVTECEVRGFTSAGLRAQDNAVVRITAATRIHANGGTGTSSDGLGPAGLLAVGSATVIVDGAGASEQQPTEVSDNVGNGIEVRGQAHVDIAGTASLQNLGTGTVVAKNNSLAGMYVEQLLVAQGAAGPTGMTVSGFVATLNGVDGLHLVGGSGVKVRASYLSHNGGNGVSVQTNAAFVAGGAGANSGNDMSRFDFGTSVDPGRNVLQDAANPNARKGLCLELSAGKASGTPLALRGNVFAVGGVTVDCTQIAGALPATGDCSGAGPLGDSGRNPKNDFDVAQCVVP